MRGIILALGLLPGAASAQDSFERALVKQIFVQLNPVSIRENREYCGYIGFDAAGQLTFSQPTPGDESSCLADDPVGLEVIMASYHTHGAFSLDYFNEVPSGDDVEGDEAEGIDGWMATPGGRLWYVDSGELVISQVCGIGCLPMDPDFIAGADGLIAESYSYDQLVQLLEN